MNSKKHLDGRSEELGFSAYSRATGVQFLTVFGVFWLLGSLVLPQQHRDQHVLLFNLIAFAVGGMLATVLYFRARRTKTSIGALANTSINSPTRARRSRIFRIINTGQYLSLGVSGLVLNYIHRVDLLVPVGIMIVGAHFLPLALLFKYPFHLVTGLLLVAWSVAYPQWLATGSLNPLGLSVTGIILLLSAMWSSHTAAKLAVDSRKLAAADHGAWGAR